mmetsp:Transcript_65487/g.211169  ORF Transcript_65487/g.211169 Transcript_65487/m.211169 type:complete len:97 (-) Transcript_65487:112-402(-)
MAEEGGGDAEKAGGDKAEEDEQGACKKCLFGCLDVLAVIFKSIVTCVSSCWRATQENIVYPIKEKCVDCYDSINGYLSPYKKSCRVPYTRVPHFRF